MVKPLVGSSLVVALALVGASFVASACSSSWDSTFADEPPKNDPFAEAPISNLVPEAGKDAADAAPESCPPAIPAAFTPAWKAPTKASACSKTQLDEYWTKCLANPAKSESDGSCAAWKAANKECGDCAEPDDKTGPIQWQESRKFYTLNIAGCLEVARQKPELAECAEAYNAAVQCARESCSFCFGLGGTFDQFRDCQRLVASEGICKSYENVQANRCQGIKNAGEPTLQCFNSGSESQQAHFTRVVGLTCAVVQ